MTMPIMFVVLFFAMWSGATALCAQQLSKPKGHDDDSAPR